MRIGVYVCECGINISATVDVGKVVDYAKSLPNVAVSRIYKYMCSDPGQVLIEKDIKELGLDKVVVASCSPGMHEPTFRKVLEEAGLNPYCLEMANIREQCSWVHEDREKATEKAIALVAGAIAKASYLEPLKKKKVSVTPQAMIIGAGITGIQTALDIADTGYKVYLVEKEPSIGGRMAQLDKTFPTLDCSACILTPKMVDAARHKNIELLTYADVIDVGGFVGNFKVKVKKKPRYVDLEKCTGCGDCARMCPISVPDAYNMNLGVRNAAYVPFPQAVPLKYTIDKRDGVSPCKAACPAGVNAHGYVALIGDGKFQEAVDLVKEKVPLPSVCGRVCHHPCETECNRKDLDDPIAICALKRFVGDYGIKHGVKTKPPEVTKKEKIAIIGSGPAGLTAAYNLAKMGYSATIFEALPIAGGMLAVGIPDYRLPKDILQAEIDAIKALGVEIKTNSPIGKDLTLDNLRDQYDAVFISTGAHNSLKLKVDGEDLDGVYHGVEFLRDVNIGKEVKLGKNVAVIGGGNAAIDSVRTAKRLGADAFIVYRRSKAEMPANESEIEETEQEGIKIHYLAAPTKIIGKDGKVTGLSCTKMELGEPDASGRRRPIPIKGSEFAFAVDTIIPAISQSAELSFLEGKEKFEISKWNTIKTDSETLITNVPGVFAGGDVVSGPSTVVDAFDAGNKVAISIDKYLKGEPLKESEKSKEPKVIEYEDLDTKDIESKPRDEGSFAPVDKRVKDFNEVALGLSEEAAIEEAKRCLNCGICSECGECLKACEELQAIDLDMKEEILDLEVGSIVMATGFDLFDPAQTPEYGYEKYDNVITGLEFERLVSASGPTEGHVEINGKEPKKVVFIQCVGSRDRDANEYCSRVCCMYTAKHAHLIREKIPNADLTVFYTDVRAFGKGFEEFYNRVQDEGVEYRRRELDDPIEVIKENERVIVRAKDHPDLEADLVVLATGIVPRQTTNDTARILRIAQSADGFLSEAHPKLRPIDTLSDGIFLAGCCQSPKDIPDSVAQASGAASRVCDILSKEELEIDAITAQVDESACRGCGYCVEACPYEAVELKEVNQFGHIVEVASVNEALCKGCGACAAACLSGAIQQNGFSDEQVLNNLHGILASEAKK